MKYLIILMVFGSFQALSKDCDITNYKDFVFSKTEAFNLIQRKKRGCYLTGAYLSKADLKGANLTDAVLREAYLNGAYLRGAILRRADLTGAYLKWADLRRAFLSEAF